MPVEIIEVEQGTPEWFRARMGIPTASEFASVLASGRGGAESKTRRKYLMRLAYEAAFGNPIETYENADMVRGREMEAEARKAYAFLTDADPIRVGFIRNGNKGCSPDSLIGDKGMLEIKTQRGDLLLETWLKNEFPPEHKAQCQGALWVAEREWIDICIYWPGIEPFVKREHVDMLYQRTLADAVEIFNAELTKTIEQVRRFGNAKAA